MTSDGHGFLGIATVSSRGVDHSLFFPEGWAPEVNGDAVYANGTAFLAYEHLDPEATSSTRVFTRTLMRTRGRAFAP